MSWDVNNVVLLGRLTRDPEIRYSQAGLSISSFSIAVGGRKSTKKESSTNTYDEVSYFDIVGFGKTAELCSQYLSKGKQVAVIGYLRQNRWEDQNGKKRSKVEIIASQVQFLSSASGSNGSNLGGGQYNEFNDSGSGGLDKSSDNNDLLDDDIPF